MKMEIVKHPDQSNRVTFRTHNAPGHANPASDLGLVDLFRRRTLLILVVLAMVFSIAAIFINDLPRAYSATAILALDVGRHDVLPVSPVVSELPTDTGVLEAEVQLLLSPQ